MKIKNDNVSKNKFTFKSILTKSALYLFFAEKYNFYRYRNNNDIVTSVPPSWLFFRHGGVLRYINSYGNIRIASWHQRFKDKWRGYFSAWKQGKFFDSILDHNMGKYHEYIANMDDNGEQLPK